MVWEKGIHLLLLIPFCLLVTLNGLFAIVLSASITQIYTDERVRCPLHASRPFNSLRHIRRQGCEVTGPTVFSLITSLGQTPSWQTQTCEWLDPLRKLRLEVDVSGQSGRETSWVLNQNCLHGSSLLLERVKSGGYQILNFVYIETQFFNEKISWIWILFFTF